MNVLLLFFAFPVATILLAIVLEKVLESPILVGISFFAFYLVITYAFFDSDFLIFAIAYTVLAVITACLVRFIQKCLLPICCKPTRCPSVDQTADTQIIRNDADNTLFLANVTPSGQNSPRVVTGRIQINGNERRGNCCCRR